MGKGRFTLVASCKNEPPMNFDRAIRRQQKSFVPKLNDELFYNSFNNHTRVCFLLCCLLAVLLDYTRGSRGGECSSRTMLTPLIDEFGSQRVRVSLYHSPFLRGLVRWLPHKWNEVIGLQHIKVYIFDDNVILSGYVESARNRQF